MLKLCTIKTFQFLTGDADQCRLTHIMTKKFGTGGRQGTKEVTKVHTETVIKTVHVLPCISNEKVCRCTHQPPLTHIIRTTCLKYFGHIARVELSMDHRRAFKASVVVLPRDWNRQSGRPCHTYLRTTVSDLAPLNIGLATAYQRAQNCQAWSKLTSRSGNVQHRTSRTIMKMIMLVS